MPYTHTAAAYDGTCTKCGLNRHEQSMYPECSQPDEHDDLEPAWCAEYDAKEVIND